MFMNITRGALTSGRLSIFRCSIAKSFIGVQSSSRCYSDYATKESNNVNNTLDDPVKGNLVYLGAANKVVKCVKVMSISTTVVAVSMQPVLLKQIFFDNNFSIGMIFPWAFTSIMMLTPLLLHWVTKRYVGSIYFNDEKETFTATTYDILAFPKVVTFTPKDVSVPRGGSMFNTIMINGKKPLFFDPRTFLNKEAYIKMMKYDEPLEWEIHQDESDNKK